MVPIFFKNQNEFRKWLEKNHLKETEVIVGYYKVDSAKKGMSWSESVDQAICFGWIDGVRRSIDHESYSNRFTPRKKTSNWSAINIKKVEELTKLNLMKSAGISAFERRMESKSRIYSHESAPAKLSKKLKDKFMANKKAWTNFQTMPKSYPNAALHWVMTAKQESTSLRRVETLIEDSKAGRKIKALRR